MRPVKGKLTRLQILYLILVFILFLSWLILYRTCSVLPYNEIPATPLVSIEPQIRNPSSSSNSELLYGLSQGMNIRRKNFKKLISQKKHLRVIFIIGVEGTGHHLWEDIFESLQSYSTNIIIDKYYTGRNKQKSSTKLQPCLLQCFSSTMWYAKSNTNALQKHLQWNCPDCHKFINDSCHCVQLEIQKYSEKMNDGDILFLNHAFSYSFYDLSLRNHPDLNIFIDAFQGDTINHMKNIFDIRFIVMRRDYINSIVSSCVTRFGSCMKRIQFLSKMLTVIQAQLMSIDTQFWIMLDYDDLIRIKKQYVEIIGDWIGIDDMEIMRKAIMESVKVKTKKEGVNLHKGIERSGWDKLRYDVTDVSDRYAWLAMKKVFYEEGRYQWPLFNSSYFLVTPKNRAFLDSKYHLTRK